jgi:hypothetical protein
MAQGSRFRTLLPVAQCGLAALFGGIGLWQRSAILNRPFFGGTLWNSTARFHVWPYKFAVVTNMPGLFAGLFLVWPLGIALPKLPESAQIAPILLFVALLWYWVGSRLDRLWRVSDKTPWLALFVFTLVCLAGAFLPMGYVGYIPYGIVVWMITALAVSRFTRRCCGMPAPDLSKDAALH